ncbi:MAG: tRNA dihydrouridine synthase DusB [Lactovum sp.]
MTINTNYTGNYKIGNVTINNRIVLAPMAGITNKAFLTTAKEFGAGLVVSEMISDKGIEFRNKKTLDMLDFNGVPHPLSIQIFGSEIESLAEAAKFVEENTTADIIDINMGCPVPKVTKNDAGSRLLLDPDKVYTLVKAVSSSVNLPVTVKIRLGWDKEHILCVENAKAIEAAGAGAVSMHTRTRAQQYTGNAQENWQWLRKIAEQINIPLIGNGDIKSPEDAKKMIDETGVTAVMIGRAALGNPWILKRTTHYFETGELITEPTTEEKIETAKLHLERLVQLHGKKLATLEFRSQASYYLKGAKGASKVKVAINQANSPEEVFDIFNNYILDI